MNGKAAKAYGDALFELIREEQPDKLTETLNTLRELNKVLDENPSFIKLMKTPTISMEEKLTIMNDLCTKGGIDGYVSNFLMVLTEKGRLDCLSGIYERFLTLHNEHFKIAEITVTTSVPLTEELRKKITARMEEVTGMSISMTEKTDPAILGGIVISYGNERLDGSIKSKLDGIKEKLFSVIA